MHLAICRGIRRIRGYCFVFFLKIFPSFNQKLNLNITHLTTSLTIFFLHLNQVDVVIFSRICFRLFLLKVWLNFNIFPPTLFIHL